MIKTCVTNFSVHLPPSKSA